MAHDSSSTIAAATPPPGGTPSRSSFLTPSPAAERRQEGRGLGDVLRAALPTASVAAGGHAERDQAVRRSIEADATRERVRRAEALLERCGVPARYADASLAYPDALLAAVPAASRRRYAAVADRLRGLYDKPCLLALLGPRGPGKTWLACGLVRDFCRAGRSARFIDALDYFVSLRQTYGRHGSNSTGVRDEGDVEREHVRPDLLVIDELHERGDTAWEDRMLTRLINKRYGECRATVLVSNDNRAVFAERVGPSIADRLCDDGGGAVECDWPSLRRSGQREAK